MYILFLNEHGYWECFMCHSVVTVLAYCLNQVDEQVQTVEYVYMSLVWAGHPHHSVVGRNV